MNNYISVEVFIENDVSGDWGKEFPDEKHKTKVFCVRGADINDLNIGKIENLPVRYVKEASKDKFLEKGNIIIEISGGSPTQSTGRVAFLENIDREVVCSNFCRALKIKKEYSPKYVFYLLQNIYNSGVFFNFESKTSGIKNLLYNSAFENIKVPNQDYSSQQKIENVITVIDKKIQLLHQINDNLAELAKTIYDYWFVQFDFPDENGKPYKSSGGKMVYNEVLKREIPEGWEVKRIEDYCKSSGGYAFKSSEWKKSGNPIIKIKNIQEDNSLNIEDIDFVDMSKTIDEKFKANAGDVVIAMTGATIGKFAIVPKTDNGFCVNQRVGIFKLNEFKKLPFLINTLNQDYFRKNIIEISCGAAQPNISNEQINNIELILPISNIVEKFNNRMTICYEKIIQNRYKVYHLQSLRDWLLPMLMNGQMSVE